MNDSQNSINNNATSSIFNRLVLILFLAMLGSVVAGVLVQGLGGLMGMDYMETVKNLKADAPIAEKHFVKIALCISHFCTFILPSIIFFSIVYKKNWQALMRLERFPNLSKALIGGLLLLAAFPIVQFIFTLNRQLPLPEWALEQEALINQTIENLLIVNGPSELLFNIFTIAFLPAIGEELLFRGILQQNLEKGIKNHHFAIWATALIFSFIHFQFQGFLPRVLLGGMLGYLLVWTRNLWIPIIAHFIYNAGQVLLQYFHQQGILGIDLNEIEVVPIWLVGMSLVGSGILGYFLYKNRNLTIV